MTGRTGSLPGPGGPPGQSALRLAVRDLDPGYFSVVMATGIVSQAMHLDSANAISAALLAVGAAVYVVLSAASIWRLAGYRAEFLGDARDPAHSCSFYTFVAASDVLAARLATDGQTPVAIILLALAAAAWLLFSYTLPLLAAGWRGATPALAKANGSWFLWVVGTESLAVAATDMRFPSADVLGALAIICWSIGILLYLITAGLVTSSLLQYPRRPVNVTPPYWIFMGASAICVLAGAQVLRLPPQPLSVSVRGVVSGLSVALWGFGTWLIPVLLAVGAWRHLLCRVPLRYELGLWSIVFPLGMDSVASRELGYALGVPWLAGWGRIEAWFALAAWLAVSLGLVADLLRRQVVGHRH